MDRKKKKNALCKCPPKVKRECRHPKTTACKSVTEIIEALTMEADYAESQKKKVYKPPKFKTKPYKPPHFKDTCVPMVPSMHTRLRYIGHCPFEPPSKSEYKLFSKNISSRSSDTDTSSKKDKMQSSEKKVRYSDQQKCVVKLPLSMAIMKHTPPDQTILTVPSPKTSGEVIQAQKANTKSLPPLPSKSGHDVFKPHSGIIINRDPDYVPEAFSFPGYGKNKKNKQVPCHKGGRCNRKTCTRRKCRKMAAKLWKRQQERGGKRYGSRRAMTGARDGRPRAKYGRKSIKDNDSICNLDDIQRTEHVQPPRHLKHGMLATHSLTVLPCTKDKNPDVHYGILMGSCNMYDAKFGGRSRGKQALAMSVMAYCLAFHYHPKQWSTKLVDNLVDAGDVWYLQCLNKVHDHSAYQGICEVLPFGKKQILVLNGKRMQLLLGDPEIIGYTMTKDPTVYNLCRGLKAFFKDHRAGVFLSRVLKVVIWKDKICYYIFDPSGRDSRAYSNYTNGSAALINVKDVPGVADILLARSILDDQKYLLAPVKVLRMVDEKCDDDFEEEKEFTQAEKAMMGYRILNQNCAIVNANMHLGDRCFEDAKFRQALTIAVAAMCYAKISPPNTWFSKTLDKVIRLGNKLFNDCCHPKVLVDLTIDNIPNEITIGPYTCEIIIYRERVKGQLFTTKECIFNIRTGVEEFFAHEYNSGILQFNNYTMAVWRQKDMYYLFDPYPRATDGTRTLTTGRACCWMLLSPDALADVFTNNWDYMPSTSLFCIHAFKVLKLHKKAAKSQIVCTLSNEHLGGRKVKRKVLPMGKSGGDRMEVHNVFPVSMDDDEPYTEPHVDEEKMGDIISLIDSIQEDYLPPIPRRYKKGGDEPFEPRVVNLDSPTVSVTQVVPPWPKPRDKSNEIPEPDPDPEPTPPPTPPPVMPPEGAEEEEEEDEEEEDEETRKAKKEEEARRKAEEEEARRKAEELPPPLPPPPPTPQSELEVPLAPMQANEEEVETVEPVQVDRKILLTEDARYRFALRKLRKQMTPALEEYQEEIPPAEELAKPNNFKDLPDNSQIIRGKSAATDERHPENIMPFAAIMAIVTSFKYAINTWTVNIVTFVTDTAQKLYSNKLDKFQMAPIHIIPKIAIGHQAYSAHIDVYDEGPTWQLEEVIGKFLTKYDRGMITTMRYSCAFFVKNGLYYLYDAGACNGMGLRDAKNQGKSCFLRFRTLHDLAARIAYNKNGPKIDQQFVLSKILVKRLLVEPRLKLPDDYDFKTGMPKSNKSKTTIDPDSGRRSSDRKSSLNLGQADDASSVGYKPCMGTYIIEGTTSINHQGGGSGIQPCHFVCLIAMLMAAMHPIRTWTSYMVDTCIEKGLEISEKATNLSSCDKRVIKNIILDGKFINVNIKKIVVINENREKSLEQYLKAVMNRLRFVIISSGNRCMVICRTERYYHLFNPYKARNPRSKSVEIIDDGTKGKAKKGSQNEKKLEAEKKESLILETCKTEAFAGWILNQSIDSLIQSIKSTASTSGTPEFYTFELTSMKTAPHHSALNHRLSPLFRPDDNPNMKYLKPKKIRPLVDEKMYWLDISSVPWARTNCVNDLGFPRGIPKTMWNDWDIEFPGDLYSLWGFTHPRDNKFKHNGQQYLATSVVAIALTKVCELRAWTGSFIDGIVVSGDKYHEKCLEKIGVKKNHEMKVEDLGQKLEMYPFSFSLSFEKVIFGFVYNILPDRFNLSNALSYFFEKHETGLLVSPVKNLAFGRIGSSYFMFDCQTYGIPIFNPGKGVAYILKCESLNRLVYCITLTVRLRRHGEQFHLYSVKAKNTSS